MILIALLSTVVSAAMVKVSISRTERSTSDESFEEELRNGYDLLKGEPDADYTMRLVQQLHYMENDMQDYIKDHTTTIPSVMNSSASKEMKNNMENKMVRRIRDIRKMDGTIEQVNEHSKVSVALFQGDILLTEEQAQHILDDVRENKGYRKKRQAYHGKDYQEKLWSRGVNYHFYNATPTAQRVFKAAAAIWSWDTCINFGETDKAPDRITVIQGSGCWSHIGKVGGPQRLSLGAGCESVGTAAHEIGHALGLYHTHARHDRDSFVEMRLENLRDGWKSQFNKQTTRTNYNYGLTYDYGSVMHYGAKRVSKNGQPYMIPYDRNYLQTLGSPMISFYDRLMINTHYGCLNNCKGKQQAACKNDGYPHPRNCSVCICPSGYGGILCDELPKGCGGKLSAKDDFQILNSTVGKRDYNPYGDNDRFLKCHYWVEAPLGYTIEVRLDNYTINLETDGCIYAGVEIKTTADKRRTGYRFCSPKYIGTTLFSTHNVVPIITYSRVHDANTILSYRIAKPSSRSHCDYRIQCSILVKMGYCRSSFYDKETNKHICPGFCS